MAADVAEGTSAEARAPAWRQPPLARRSSGQRARRERAFSKARLLTLRPALSGEPLENSGALPHPLQPLLFHPLSQGNLWKMAFFPGLRLLLPAHQCNCSWNPPA